MVAAIGLHVQGVKTGDRVVLVFVPMCGNCRACTNGRPALCHRGAESNGSGDLLHGDAILRTTSGERVNHHLGVSAFSEYAVVARESVVVIDDDVPLDVAAMFGCAALTGIGAVIHSANVTEGQSVIVFGLGAVGPRRGHGCAPDSWDYGHRDRSASGEASSCAQMWCPLCGLAGAGRRARCGACRRWCGCCH